jgi:dihydrodipicolinate synthase/N-acetylneuraminate lyase
MLGIADRGDLRPAVSTYSSAVFNFVPEFATAFYAAVRRCDHAVIDAGPRNFILPLIAIRNRKKGRRAGCQLARHHCAQA